MQWLGKVQMKSVMLVEMSMESLPLYDNSRQGKEALHSCLLSKEALAFRLLDGVMLVLMLTLWPRF